MEAGKLRHKITIQQEIPSSTPDTYGQHPVTWTDVITVRASVVPNKGREYYAAIAAQSDVEIVFGMRYVSLVKNNMRVLYNNEQYEILSAVNVEERNRELIIYAKKVI